MVLILDGNSEHVAHEWSKIGGFGEKRSNGSWSNQMTDKIPEIDLPDVRTYLGVTI